MPGDTPTVQDAIDSEAVRLFVERAQAVKGDFALTPDNAAVLLDICRRVDGLPLAIELAAARVKVVPPSALLARLEKRLPLLTGGGRDLPARQQTMRDAIAWSHDLLTAEEQRFFRRLAVFVGGFTLEAAEAVAGGDDLAIDVLDGVASLVEQSLLREEDGPGGEPRYLMLETVREFGLEQLAAAGEEAAIRDRHAAWCLGFADRAAAGLIPIVRPGHRRPVGGRAPQPAGRAGVAGRSRPGGGFAHARRRARMVLVPRRALSGGTGLAGTGARGQPR